MEIIDVNIKFGMATVTPKGLFFSSQFFTNPYMIRNKWFERAKKGNWYVPVYYQISNPNEIMLLELVYLYKATKVEVSNEFSETEKERYFEAFCNLKKDFFSKYKSSK
ncbi:MAG: hypothetical protein WD469_04895 [Paenibacillaceae bacterium]